MEGVVIVRRLGQAGEIGGLREGQLVDRFVEIVQRGGGDAVIAEAEIDFIEIEFEDVVLGIGLLDAQAQQGLLDLAIERAFVGQKEVLRHLLGDGRGALYVARALGKDHDGAHHAFRVDAVMGVEILVLGRDEGVLHQIGDGVGRQVKPALMGIFREDRSVAGMNAGHDRRVVILELRIVRQVLRIDVDQHADRRARRPRKQSRPSRRESRRTGRSDAFNHLSRSPSVDSRADCRGVGGRQPYTMLDPNAARQ